MKTFAATYRRYGARYLPFMCLLGLLAAGMSVCEMLITRQTGFISDAAVAFDINAIITCLIAMGVLTALKMAFSMASAVASGRYSGRVRSGARRSFAEQFLFIPFKALSGRSSGEVLSMYSNDLPGAARLITDDMFQLLSELMMLLVAAGFMVYVQPLYTLIFFASFPLLAMMQVAISKPIQPLVAEAAKLRGEYNAVVADSLQNTAAVAAYSLETVMEKRYGEVYNKYFQAQMKRISVFARLIIAGLLATFTPVVFVTIAAALSVVGGRMTIGTFVAFISLAGQAGSFLTMLSQRIAVMRDDSARAENLSANMADEREVLAGEAGAVDPSREAIEFRGVSFTYGADENSPMALDGISFRVAKGSRVAIVGASGSGKSTASKLMQTLYEPTGGEVFIMGQNAATTPKQQLRDMISCVPQDTFLFPESIGSNIACSLEGEIDEERLAKACEGAGILEFIKGLPQGFDTVLAEGGDNLSGGQRQRLSIARALYRNAPIMLLDEATSALDPATERMVLKSLREYTAGKTMVVVAHRLAAIADCDQIFVMDKGRVIEQGSFDELMGRKSAFAALYAKQEKEGAQA